MVQRMTSADYEATGLTGGSVEGLQVNALKMELQREKNTVESLQQDIELLRQQLDQSEQRFREAE